MANDSLGLILKFEKLTYYAAVFQMGYKCHHKCYDLEYLLIGFSEWKLLFSWLRQAKFDWKMYKNDPNSPLGKCWGGKGVCRWQRVQNSKLIWTKLVKYSSCVDARDAEVWLRTFINETELRLCSGWWGTGVMAKVFFFRTIGGFPTYRGWPIKKIKYWFRRFCKL